ncbi:coiled-coil domain-containing protein 158-like isoform X3 [Salvelinus sp. IW2-2015]|uniref:coiled-coil domain-containing protein 158-like isoform X3 n=1 Tax=Salvelinus sp. IW2-2015 TaxID=2691554 RepID=UPI000CDFC78E|nr:coiled-coil domain-containing protein 158-like isoform X3 [Salvelinus alpinus]
MSSVSQNSIHKDSDLSIHKSSELFDDGLLHEIPTTTTTSTNDTSTVPKRYKNLDELSEELNRRTKETQMLQEEVEHATKIAMEQMGRTFPSSSPSQINYFPIFMDGSSEENSEVLSPYRPSLIQPLTYDRDGLDLKVVRSGVTFPGKDVLENVIEDYSQQVSELQKQLSEMCAFHEQQKFKLRQSIIKLQTKLHEVQIEKDALTDLRMKESRKQADVMGKMHAIIRALQINKQTGDQRLLEAEEEAKSQSRKAESMERILQEVHSTLLAYEKRCRNDLYTSHDALGVAVEKVLQDLEHENHNLRERFLLVEEQMETQEQKCQDKAEIRLKEQREKLEQLITRHDQEVAILTEKLSSSRSSASSLCVQVELLQKQGESQASVHQCQVKDLESAFSILRSDLLDGQRVHEDKVSALEKQLAEAQSQVEEAQRGRDGSLQQAEELDSQLCQLTSELRQAREELAHEKEETKQLWERDTGHNVTGDGLRRELEERRLGVQQLEVLVGSLKDDCQAQMEAQVLGEKHQWEQQEELAVLRGELKLTTDQLNRARDEELRLQALQGDRDQALKRVQALLEERDRELQLRQQEAQQGRARLEEAQGHCQALRAETEVLRLKLEDREKMVDLLRLQMESTTQMTVQHGRSIDSLHDEKRRLSNQLSEHKLEIQQLRTDLEQREQCLAVLEKERRVQQAGLSEQSHCDKELKLEKQKLTAELEMQRMQLVTLTEEHEELKRLHSSKSEEQEGVVVSLKAQLKTTRAEMDQARRTLEEADRHGLKVALGMQKQIKTKRDQVHSLQGRIQLLEETMDKMSQEKHYQSLESKRQLQELASVTEEKRQMAAELETVRSLERRLREKVAKLEATLHKMSGSVIDCQHFIQLQEQAFVRLKLQHAQDVKQELQGQNLRVTGNAQRSSPTSPTARNALPSTQHRSNFLLELKSQRLLESPTMELRSLVKELRRVISENPGPHTSIIKRTSAQERAHRTTLNEVTNFFTNNAKTTKGTYSSGVPHLLRTTDLDERNLNSTSSESQDFSFVASLPCYTSSPRAMALGRTSPVHSLLTTDHSPTDLQPSRPLPQAGSPLADMCTLANPQAELTGHTCKHLQGKLDSLQNMVDDLQMKNQDMSSMIKGQERRLIFKDKGMLYNKQGSG